MLDDAMSKQELLQELRRLNKLSDSEAERAHALADKALLQYINDPDIIAAFDAIKKWYS